MRKTNWSVCGAWAVVPVVLLACPAPRAAAQTFTHTSHGRTVSIYPGGFSVSTPRYSASVGNSYGPGGYSSHFSYSNHRHSYSQWSSLGDHSFANGVTHSTANRTVSFGNAYGHGYISSGQYHATPGRSFSTGYAIGQGTFSNGVTYSTPRSVTSFGTSFGPGYLSSGLYHATPTTMTSQGATYGYGPPVQGGGSVILPAGGYVYGGGAAPVIIR